MRDIAVIINPADFLTTCWGTQKRLIYVVLPRYVTNTLRYVTNALRYVTNALRYVTIALRYVTNALRYVTNHTLHRDFNSPYVNDVIHERINKHHNKLEAHPNPLLASPV